LKYAFILVLVTALLAGTTTTSVERVNVTTTSFYADAYYGDVTTYYTGTITVSYDTTIKNVTIIIVKGNKTYTSTKSWSYSSYVTETRGVVTFTVSAISVTRSTYLSIYRVETRAGVTTDLSPITFVATLETLIYGNVTLSGNLIEGYVKAMTLGNITRTYYVTETSTSNALQASTSATTGPVQGNVSQQAVTALTLPATLLVKGRKRKKLRRAHSFGERNESRLERRLH